MGDTMNEKRRNTLRNAMDLLTRASIIVDSVCDEESDAMDNIPENLQGTERYEAMEDAIDCLNEASEKIEEARECIEQAIRG